MILSLPVRVYIIYRKTNSVHEDGIIFFWQEYIPYVSIRDKNANCQLTNCTENRFVLSSFLRSIHSFVLWSPC